MNNDICFNIKMGDKESEQFTMTWFYRAMACTSNIDTNSPQYGERHIDLADRFISLWICYNSILRESHGERLNDKQLIDAAGKDKDWEEILQRKMGELCYYLNELMKYTVKDMKSGNSITLNSKEFEKLIQVIYQIRCNLFHGRKLPYEDKNSIDFKLIKLAHLILAPLVTEYLKSKDLVKIEYCQDYGNVADSDFPKPVLEIEDFEGGFIFEFR